MRLCAKGMSDMDESCGRFVWYELFTTDTEAAKEFYGTVVGLGMRDVSRAGSVYTLFTASDVPVASLSELPAEAVKAGVPPQWIGYVAVDDVDAAAGRVKKLGGNIHLAPADVPNLGRFSMISDPEMATLALVKRREGGPFGQFSGLGRVGWHELLAADLVRAFAFYSKLFGWHKSQAHIGSMGTYQLFSAGSETIGGMFARPEMSPMSMWLYYVNVADIDAAVKRAAGGGGQIFYGPVAVPGGARIAHCMDPQGALFGLIDWHVRIAVACYSPQGMGSGSRGQPR
jgi:predicted enzyme related to lactoylglutathione lyase